MRIIREKEFQMLLALADPISKAEALKYSAQVPKEYEKKIEPILWWKLRRG